MTDPKALQEGIGMDRFELSVSYPTSTEAETLFRVQITQGANFIAKFQLPITEVGRLLKGEFCVPGEGMVARAANNYPQVQRERDELLAYNTKLIEILKDLFGVITESEGIAGWHLNGNVALWDEFEFTSQIQEVALNAEQGGGS